MAPLAMPEMIVGENSFAYSDQSANVRKVRITHQWVERSASQSPSAPPAANCPPDGGEANGTDIVFQWTAAQDPDGDAIPDYHFELSTRADLRYPLSLDFYKLISRTADVIKEKGKGGRVVAKAQYALPQPGLLTPDRKYYWHVRAMDDQGLWGPWSKTWSFIPRGPAIPVKVTLDFDPVKGTGILRWTANSIGRRPTQYRIYGSDEKGFTIADKAYQSTVGITKAEMAPWNPWFPANFIAETTATELEIIGANVKFPAANKTYYRVVAVDEQGKRSGPSDYATAPRPTIFGKPTTQARVGTEYRCQLQANRSLGDLRLRIVNGKETANFWDIEKPRFAIEQGPAWLKIDPATGLLSGTPAAAGKIDVAVTVTIDQEVRKLDDGTLGWGNEKVTSISTERVGSATRRYSIEVSR